MECRYVIFFIKEQEKTGKNCGKKRIDKMEAQIKVILPYEKTGEYFIEDLGKIEKKPVYDFCKRFFDIVASVFALVILLIPMAVISIGIKCSSKGKVFYFQERLGLNGKKISVIKFRTMREDAENECIRWSDGDDDDRIYPLGRFLRKTRLDELPQFWCILKGDMSIVGPRPERECFYKEFETYIHGFSERMKVIPGLTGHAQVNGGYDLKPEEKIIYDVEYIKNRSLWFDFKIIFSTVKTVFTQSGAK